MTAENDNSNHRKQIAGDLKEMQEAIHKGAMFVVGNSKDITALQEWQERQNGTLAEMNQCLKDIKKQIARLQAEDIANLRLEMAKGKPSWAVLIIISFLLSMTVGAIVFALKTTGGI